LNSGQKTPSLLGWPGYPMAPLSYYWLISFIYLVIKNNEKNTMLIREMWDSHKDSRSFDSIFLFIHEPPF
jgi:hypothetical protein